MLISHESAMRIVTEVSSIIDHDVNMMDEQGLIIASTDPARLGTVHGGARRLLKEGLDELIVENEDEYEGARPGVNLPLLFEGETVGVIGLTGRTNEVRQFGRIIKKMTEILLLDSWAERQKQLKAAMWNQFIEEWLFSSASQVDDAFAERGLQLGIDIREPRIVFVVRSRGDRKRPTARRRNSWQRPKTPFTKSCAASAAAFTTSCPTALSASCRRPSRNSCARWRKRSSRRPRRRN